MASLDIPLAFIKESTETLVGGCGNVLGYRTPPRCEYALSHVCPILSGWLKNEGFRCGNGRFSGVEDGCAKWHW